MSERWLPVVGYEGRYEVSDQGRVRSLRFVNGKVDRLRAEPLVLAHSIGDGGHHRVGLCLNGRVTLNGVHVLALQAFVGPRPAGHVGTHDNGDPSANHLSNLVWATQKKNMADKARHGTAQRGERANGAKLTDAQVREIRAATGTHRSIALRFGVSRPVISKIIRRESWTHVE